MQGPLAGIKVLDFMSAQQPYAQVMLSDFGAEVIKVEPRIVGDIGRGLALGRADESTTGYWSFFWANSRGMKSITLDMKKLEAKEIVLKLAEQVDVVAHNFRVGVMDRLGIGYEALKARNPRIIYANVTAMGSRGPKSNRPGYDIIGQAVSGFMSVTGAADQPPTMAGSSVSDHVTTLNMTIGILAAIVARDRFGVGQEVEVSIFGSSLGMQAPEIDNYIQTGQFSRRTGRSHTLFPQIISRYQTADGYLVITGVGDDRWIRMCQVMNLPELAKDEGYRHGRDRELQSDVLIPILEARFRQRTTAEWMKLFEENDLIGAPVQNYAEVVADPQAWANDYMMEMEDPVRGPVKLVGNPIRLSETQVKPQGAPPGLGEHNEEVLTRLGYSAAEIERLRKEEVI